MICIRKLVLAACGLALAAPVATVLAQAYPDRPIRFIVPFPPGGGNDIVGRIVAQKLAEGLKQTVVVDNRGGAGGTIGTDMTAKAPADGHTMLVNNISLAVNATLIPKLPYDTLRQLVPVSIIGRQPNILVVHPGVKAKNVKELLDLARAKPGGVNYGSGGVGTASHLATELLQLSTGTKMTHVPYKGLGPALIDLMGGRTEFIISTMASALPQLKSGKLRPLAATTVKRSAFFPEVPTMIESGVAGYDFTTWYALVVPAGVPKPVMARLNGELKTIAGMPAVKEQFSAQGLETAHTGSDEAQKYLAAEVAKWGKVIKASGATPD
ncbi:MAG: tripartite tricarboxylate transporter substrate binding protein [Burkholderiales bacterium]|nr:tripartite tricarboxylate transporter substrate binding protein [Burkholderiales bacterium]